MKKIQTYIDRGLATVVGRKLGKVHKCYYIVIIRIDTKYVCEQNRYENK